MTLREHVGRRIHLYRKKQNLTLEQLASLIHKTTSTVSKYELGKITIDIDTLYEIASVLNVTIEQLIDYQPAVQSAHRNQNDSFFTRNNLYFMYQHFSPIRKIVLSAVEIIPDISSEDDRLMFYYDCSSAEDYTNASFIYRGTIHYYDSFATMSMTNLFGAKDELFIYAKNPLWVLNNTTGLMMCLSQTLGNPAVTKVVFSTEELKDEEVLKEVLNINQKEVMNTIRRTNYLMLYDSWNKKF